VDGDCSVCDTQTSGPSYATGYINKKSQGPPGSKTLWRGMAQFETIVDAYRIFLPMTCGV